VLRASRPGGEHANIFVEIGRADRPWLGCLRMEELSQKLALATQDQDFRQVFEPIEGEVPGLHIHLGRRDSCGRRGCDALSGATFCRKCLATCSNFMVRCLDATINLFVPDLD
jgi:hypothetical protein